MKPFVLLLFLVPLVSANPAHILDFNDLFLKSVRRDSSPPAQVSRRLAIIYLAARDAHRVGKAAFYPDCPVPTEVIDSEKAALAALYTAAGVLYPSHQPFYQKAQPAIPKPARDYGRQVAFHYLKKRENDGSTSRTTYVPKTATPGQWRRTPPRFRPPELSHWGRVRPFVLDSAAQFRPPPPPELGTKAFAQQLEAVLTQGGKSNPASDRETATFWSCFSYTSTPAGHWNVILADLLRKKKDVTPAETLDAFALLNVALADAAIACWEAKYHYNFWRPESAAAHLDKTWQPCLESPPHPEYVSGHSTFAGAGATILTHLFPGEVRFQSTSDSVRDVTRTYQSFQSCAAEMGQSRVLGGIHFPISNQEGLKLGKKVAQHVLAEFKSDPSS